METSVTKKSKIPAAWNAATSPVPLRKYASLRPDFVWGAATSAYQIEGGIDPATTGRGESIWERYFSVRPQNDTGATACDHYNRMPEDVAMMKAMNLKAYRYSIAWPRVIPAGVGAINDKGLDFYKRLNDELHKAGIEPYPTLYHWDLPQAMEDKGGWASRDVAKHFAEYAQVIAEKLGDGAKNWTTLNEPAVVESGYTTEWLAPGRKDPNLRSQVVHNLMLGHGLAAQALRAVRPGVNVGCVLNLVPIEPANKYARKEARKQWQRDYSVYLDAMLKGEYPGVVMEQFEKQGTKIESDDMRIISAPLDYLGVNYYLRNVVNKKGRALPIAGATYTQVGWEIYDDSLAKMLVAMKGEYPNLPPIYITENGTALDDTIAGGRVHDAGRMNYVHRHLEALDRAAARGVDLRGYFVWSLMDNLEWGGGYRFTFGVVHVDRQTMKRTIKDSGLWYRDMIAVQK
jgi:beta-glucosidase